MKKIIMYFISAVLGCSLAWGNGLNEPHPGYILADIEPDGLDFLVGGVDLLSDGRLVVCNWGNPGDVWILDNPDGAPGDIDATRFAMGLQQSLGCTVVDDTIYVMQMGELTQLVDTDNDGTADEYNKVNDAFPTSESLLAYSYDVIHYGGYFYGVLAADVKWGGMTAEPPLPEVSMFIKMGRDNSLENLASGFRNPNGMGIAWGNKLFCVDNQGSWKPSSQIIYLEPGKFYGHRTTPENLFQPPLDNDPGTEDPPMAWLLHGQVSNSPGNLFFIDKGIYKDQLLFAEEQMSGPGKRIYRVSVEEVEGVMQGALIPFSGGLKSGVDCVVMDDNGIIYAGILGATGSWDRVAGMGSGLQRLTPKDINAVHTFEVLAVRSTGSSTIELEFTKPLQASANQTGKYNLVDCTFDPVKNYGGGNCLDKGPLNVTNASLSGDSKTVELTISDLKEGYMVDITFNNLLSAEGEVPWTPRIWHTINKFGPGQIPATGGCMDQNYKEYNPDATENDPSGCVTLDVEKVKNNRHRHIALKRDGIDILVDVPVSGLYKLELLDVMGRTISIHSGQGPDEQLISNAQMPNGIYFLRLKWKGKEFNRRIALF